MILNGVTFKCYQKTTKFTFLTIDKKEKKEFHFIDKE